jgi:hypothetical protein
MFTDYRPTEKQFHVRQKKIEALRLITLHYKELNIILKLITDTFFRTLQLINFVNFFNLRDK